MSATHSEKLRASPPMFRSRWLDRLTRVHPVVPVVLYLPLIVALLALALGRLSPAATLAWVALGYVLWTLTEYWLHRIVFHFEPEQGVGARLHWMVHGVHHDHPNDPLRLVMPPAASLPLGAAFLALFWAVLPDGPALAVGCGLVVGYLLYDMTHYLVHHHTPRSRLMRDLRERHMRHHFQDETRGFGISAPYWDRLFGTANRPRARG